MIVSAECAPSVQAVASPWRATVDASGASALAGWAPTSRSVCRRGCSADTNTHKSGHSQTGVSRGSFGARSAPLAAVPPEARGASSTRSVRLARRLRAAGIGLRIRPTPWGLARRCAAPRLDLEILGHQPRLADRLQPGRAIPFRAESGCVLPVRYNPDYYFNPPGLSYLLHLVFAVWFGGEAACSTRGRAARAMSIS